MAEDICIDLGRLIINVIGRPYHSLRCLEWTEVNWSG